MDFFFVYERIKVVFVLDVTLLNDTEFVEFGGKLKQYTRIGSSWLLLPRNNTWSHGIELVLLWNVKVLQNSLKLIIAQTVVSFSTRILTFWPWICYEAWRIVTKMSWNHLVASSLGYLLSKICHIWNVSNVTLSASHKPWCF